jgi:DNA-binding NtrC family response regulator
MDARSAAILTDRVERFAQRRTDLAVLKRPLHPAVFPEGEVPGFMSTRQTILIVDHERNTRQVLARELTPMYEVLLAEDGLEAVCVYETHREQIATILIDLRLPRLNGRAVAEWVHHIRPELPIIVMSKAIETAVKELPESAVVTFIRKPFHLSELKKLLRGVLAQQPIVYASRTS